MRKFRLFPRMLVQVEDFQVLSKQTVNEKPTLVPSTEFELRFALMKEENEEYLEACQGNNLVEVADALGDQLYILLGTINQHGMQYVIEEVFERIHNNNMTKCPDGVCVYSDTGKILKPEGYIKVALDDILAPYV